MKSPENTGKKPVISLLGVSGAGKSSVAQEVMFRLNHDGISSAVIRRDDVIRKLGRRTAGKHERLGYAIGNRDETAICGEMNQELRETLPEYDAVFLEGGTRTESARAATMAGTEDIAELTVVRFEVSPLSIAKRLQQRRQRDHRPDDNPIIMAAKLAGQYWKDFRNHDQSYEGVNYIETNANRPLPYVADTVEQIVRDQLQ